MKKLYFFLLAAMLMVAGSAFAQKDAEHPWAGTYTLMLVDDEPYHYLPESAEAWNVLTPDTFEVTIEWKQDLNKYLITNFYSLPVNNIPEGGIELKVIDETTAEIILTKQKYHSYGVTPADTVYEEYTDENGVTAIDTIYYSETVVGLTLTDGSSIMYGTEPIKVFMNKDGQISIDAFKVIFGDNMSQGFFVWSDGACPLNGGDEPVDVEPRDWTGWYWMDAGVFGAYALDGNTYPAEGAFEIAKDEWGNYIVTKFMGYDTAEANAFMSGGIYITTSKKNANKATIDCEAYMNLLQADASGMAGLALYDAMVGNGSIEMVFDEATQTITFDIFTLGTVDVMGQVTENCVYYSTTATLGDPTSLQSVIATPSQKQLYSVGGARVATPQKGVNILREVRDGKVVTRKFVVK